MALHILHLYSPEADEYRSMDYLLLSFSQIPSMGFRFCLVFLSFLRLGIQDF